MSRAEEKHVVCPSCGAEMELELQDFSIGADGGGGLLTLLADTYCVDLYACPQCGKVELFTAGFREEREAGEQAEKPPEQASSKGGGLFGFGRRETEERPPWED